MQAVLSRWGNSTAVRIPAHTMLKANISIGDKVDIDVNKQGIITLKRISNEIDFDELYAQITPENKPDYVSRSAEVGREAVVW